MTFELAGAGEILVDDVQVFDLPFTDPERVELLKLISLASVKLDSGQLADCARLLESYWPQFLVANVPLQVLNTPVARRPREPMRPPLHQKAQAYSTALKGICRDAAIRRH